MKFSTEFNDRTFHRGLESSGDIREAARYRSIMSMEFRGRINKACEEDPLLFLNLFGHTHDPRRSGGEMAFVLYPFQEKAARAILSSVGVRDLRISHSADMGVSWLNVGLALWMWLFRPNTSTLFVVRNESYLSNTNPKGFFWRLRYMSDRLPSWLRADRGDERTAWTNDNGSRISGETEFGAPGHGDRHTAIFIEDAWSLHDLPAVLECTRDSTLTRIASGRGVSTPPVDSWDALRLHWSDHPEKSAGLYRGTSEELLRVLDPVGYPDGYKPILDGRLRSPWYDHECLACGDLVSIATEYDLELG